MTEEQPVDPEKEIQFAPEEEVEYVPATDSNVLWILSSIVSFVFHPLLMATYAFLFVDLFYPYQFMHLGVSQKAQSRAWFAP